MEAILTRITYYVYKPQMLVDARLSQHLSVPDVAAGTGLNRGTIWRVETGRAASYDAVKMISVFLKLDPSIVIQKAEKHKSEMRGRRRKKISALVE